MNNNAEAKIVNTQTLENQESTTFEVFTRCRFEKLNGGGYSIEYDEVKESGFPGSRLRMEMKDNLVTIKRTGKTVSYLEAEIGKKHCCTYTMDFGQLTFGITADEIRLDMNDAGGTMYLKYFLDVNCGYTSQTEISLEVKGVESK